MRVGIRRGQLHSRCMLYVLSCLKWTTTWKVRWLSGQKLQLSWALIDVQHSSICCFLLGNIYYLDGFLQSIRQQVAQVQEPWTSACCLRINHFQSPSRSLSRKFRCNTRNLLKVMNWLESTVWIGPVLINPLFAARRRTNFHHPECFEVEPFSVSSQKSKPPTDYQFVRTTPFAALRNGCLLWVVHCVSGVKLTLLWTSS